MLRLWNLRTRGRRKLKCDHKQRGLPHSKIRRFSSLCVGPRLEDSGSFDAAPYSLLFWYMIGAALVPIGRGLIMVPMSAMLHAPARFQAEPGGQASLCRRISSSGGVALGELLAVLGLDQLADGEHAHVAKERVGDELLAAAGAAGPPLVK